MPAGAAVTSRRRRQTTLDAAHPFSSKTGRTTPGRRRLPGDMGNDRRNLMHENNDSFRNSLMGSRRKLMRPVATANSGRSGEGFNESMPGLIEGRGNDELETVKRDHGKLDASTQSNPELYIHLDHEEDMSDDESDTTIVLRQRPLSTSYRQNVPQGESSTSQINNSPDPKSRSSSNSGESFLEHVEDGSRKLSPYLKPLSKVRKIIGSIINDDIVQNTVLFLIMVNAVMMGVATLPAVKNNPQLFRTFDIADKVFLWVFTVESAMQLVYHGWNLFKDSFLVFDLLIVVMSWALEGAQVFRAFRIFRAMRLITRIKVLKSLVLALFSVVPKMTAIFMLLMLIFYIFAVMFTTLFKELEGSYFRSLEDSLFTLFQMMTLDNWADVLYETQVTFSWAWMPFVAFVVITGFVIVNLMIAVICDAVHVLGNDDKADLAGEGILSQSSEEYPYENDLNSNATGTRRRFLQLQQQLDDMIMAQEQMRSTIEVLKTKLRENAKKESASMVIEEADNTEKETQSIPSWSNMPTDSSTESLGGQDMSLSRANSIASDISEAGAGSTHRHT